MADLRMTPARVALLSAVAAPDVTVYLCRNFDTGKPMSVWRQPDSSERLVTKRAAELNDAGLIKAGPASGPSWYARKNWEITDHGRRVLAALDATTEPEED